MSGTLRQIALTVDQMDRGGYVWLLIERAGGRSFVLKKAQRAHSSYLGALDAGYQELALLSACGLHQQRVDHSTSDEAPQALAHAELQDAL